MASVDDIRVTVAWRDHPKRVKLARRLGPSGVLAIMDLWMWTGANKPHGDLSGMTDEDVEIAAQWSGDAGLFVATALELRLLDRANTGVLMLHDWSEHQRWADGAARRSEAARANINKRWEKRHTKAVARKNGANTPVSETPYGANTPSPSPSPSPNPNPEELAPATPPPPPPAKPRKPRAPKPAEPDLPGVTCTREAFRAALASSSAGRYVDTAPPVGNVFKLDPPRARPDALELAALVGAWLAAGGDAWRGTLDGRHLGDLPAWIGQAEAWARAGRPAVARGNGPAAAGNLGRTDRGPAAVSTNFVGGRRL